MDGFSSHTKLKSQFTLDWTFSPLDCVKRSLLQGEVLQELTLLLLFSGATISIEWNEMVTLDMNPLRISNKTQKYHGFTQMGRVSPDGRTVTQKSWRIKASNRGDRKILTSMERSYLPPFSHYLCITSIKMILIWESRAQNVGGPHLPLQPLLMLVEGL